MFESPSEAGFGWKINLKAYNGQVSTENGLYVRGDKAPFLLYAAIGDPDDRDWEGLYFDRVNAVPENSDANHF
jgi:hypothetical protein